jgi:hypothetical protein
MKEIGWQIFLNNEEGIRFSCLDDKLITEFCLEEGLSQDGINRFLKMNQNRGQYQNVTFHSFKDMKATLSKVPLTSIQKFDVTEAIPEYEKKKLFLYKRNVWGVIKEFLEDPNQFDRLKLGFSEEYQDGERIHGSLNNGL